jgi:hypothetical protein
MIHNPSFMLQCHCCEVKSGFFLGAHSKFSPNVAREPHLQSVTLNLSGRLKRVLSGYCQNVHTSIVTVGNLYYQIHLVHVLATDKVPKLVAQTAGSATAVQTLLSPRDFVEAGLKSGCCSMLPLWSARNSSTVLNRMTTPIMMPP